MANLKSKITEYLGRDFSFEEIALQNDGDGDYIKEWNVAEAQPTVEQLNALESQATTFENNNRIRDTRRESYGNIGDQLDEIFKDIDAWKARIQAIKDVNAKEQ